MTDEEKAEIDALQLVGIVPDEGYPPGVFGSVGWSESEPADDDHVLCEFDGTLVLVTGESVEFEAPLRSENRDGAVWLDCYVKQRDGFRWHMFPASAVVKILAPVHTPGPDEDGPVMADGPFTEAVTDG